MIRMSKEQHLAHQARIKGARLVEPMKPLGKPGKIKSTAARWERMNKTEVAYSQILEYRKRAGEIVHWGFEEVKLRLGEGAYFTPDFMVVKALPSGAAIVEFHEVKGFWREAAKVRIKVAAERYPYFSFRAVKKVAQKDGGGWKEEFFR